MITFSRLKDIAEILSYLTIVVGLPLAILQFRRAARKEQADREYGTYNALDEKYLDFLRLCFEHPRLDIFDIAGGSSDLSTDEKRQELVAFTMLFSIIERAFLMYSDQTTKIKSRQWSGWHDYLTDYCRRQNFRSAWRVGGKMFDTEFYDYVEGLIANTAISPLEEIPKSWRLRRFLGSRDTDFSDALRIFSDMRPQWLSYSSNSISYWIDHYDEAFGDRLIIAGLFKKGRVVGFTQLQYVRVTRLLFVNCAMIIKESRSEGAFRQLVLNLKTLLSIESVAPERIVAEIGAIQPLNSEARRLVRLLRLLGFHVVDRMYYTLHIRQSRIEIRKATLLVNDKRPLDTKEYLALAETLCACHVRWNLPFVDAKKLEESASRLLEGLRSGVGPAVPPDS